MSKDKEKKKRDWAKQTGRGHFSVYLPVEVKKKFQIFCIQNDVQMSYVTAALVEEFMKKPSKKKLKEWGLL